MESNVPARLSPSGGFSRTSPFLTFTAFLSVTGLWPLFYFNNSVYFLLPNSVFFYVLSLTCSTYFIDSHAFLLYLDDLGIFTTLNHLNAFYFCYLF